jgi:GntR family transcriptional regulator/MocR family aminotransferase
MVLSALPAGEPCRIDFLYGAVASRDFPTLPWRRAYQAALLQHQQRLYYAPPEGDALLRRALQGYLARARGLSCDAEQIVIVHGSQQAIDLCARILLDPGDAFAFEDPGYLMARRCFEATGAKLLAVPVDDQGLDTAQLPDDDRVRLAYTTPSHQFPLGAMLPIARRQELLQWAGRRRAWIIEDDYDGEFRYGQRPIDALQAIDREGRVIYVGTFSKALSPQLRLGYLVLPPELQRVFRQAKRLTDRHAPVLEQRALASLIDSGGYERHVRRVRRENERRRAALLDAIAHHLPPDARVAGTSAGLHVVLWLPSVPQQDEPALVAAARERGVGVHPVSPLFAGPPSRARPRQAGLILGYASLTIQQIQKGVRTLAAANSQVRKARDAD